MATVIPLHRAAATGESLTLESGDAVMIFFRRTTGWGWAEVRTAAGEPLAILDHLGELAVRDAPVPMRLEADTARRGEDEGGAYLHFDVASVTTREALRGSSFESWIGVPFAGPLIEGTLRVRSMSDGRFSLEWNLTSTHDIYARYLRGPWLSVGRGSFGADRDDAILPGIDWAIDRESTSGTDFFRDPWAQRATPPVDSVAIPVMAVSHASRWISLSWDAAAEATGWFSYRRHRLQPVFAAPDFLERSDCSLLGLALPEATQGENIVPPPLELHRGQEINFAATISVGSGSSLDAVGEHVRRTGLPDGATHGELDDAVHAIARTYGDTMFHDGDGFGVGQVAGDVHPTVPGFVTDYLHAHPDRPEAARLRQITVGLEPDAIPDVVAQALAAIQRQRDDGSFVFDPDGVHRSKDDFVVARDLVAPMGLPGQRALDLDVLPALQLLRAFDADGDERWSMAARRALDAALVHRRPEGGDYWETPLSAPNLLAAGHAVVAYGWAWQLWGDETYLVAAQRWLRSLLVFTHLWSPRDRPMLYNTKPCLCASDWYFANWVRDHVQWEVIETVALAGECGVDLAALDPSMTWERYLRGVLGAGVRWRLDHRDDSWRPHNLPMTLASYRAGQFDGCLPDTHNSTTGLYGGMAIAPGRLGQAILGLQRMLADGDGR